MVVQVKSPMMVPTGLLVPLILSPYLLVRAVWRKHQFRSNLKKRRIEMDNYYRQRGYKIPGVPFPG